MADDSFQFQRGFQNPWTSTGVNGGVSLNLKPLTSDDFSGRVAPSTTDVSGGNNVLSQLWGAAKGAYGFAKGAMSGVGNALSGNNDPNQPHGFDALRQTAQDLIHPGQLLQHNLQAVENIPRALLQGITHPAQAAQEWQQGVTQDANALPGGPRQVLKYGVGAMNDPLLYLPLGKVAQGVKAASDFAGMTPYVEKAIDAIKASPVVDNKAVNALRDTFGNAFTKFYGADPQVANGLSDLQAQRAADAEAITRTMTDMSKAHGLSGDEMDQVVRMFEGTPATSAKAQQAYVELKDVLENGIHTPAGRQLGTNAELQTVFNGNPILSKTRENYYPHRYDNTEQQVESALQQSGKKGYSISGPFNQERAFNTVDEALANGLKPEMNPYAAIGQRLYESSKALRNASLLNNLIDQGLISKTLQPGMKASELKPIDGYLTIHEVAPKRGLGAPDPGEADVPTGEPGGSPGSVPNGGFSFPGVTPRFRLPGMGESGGMSKPLTALNDEGFTLPKDLANAKPRYRGNPLQFESPLDKAAYIVGNTANRSARDAEYVQALADHTGLTEQELRAYGQHMRATVRGLGTAAKEGDTITVPRTLADLPAAAAETQTAGDLAQSMPSQLMQHAGASALPEYSNPDDFSSLVKDLGNVPTDRIVKTNPYYLTPGNERALKQYLNPPVKDSLYDRAVGKWKNMSTYNSLVHGHNIAYNGMYLGGAKLDYVAETFRNLAGGQTDPWYQRALRAGAVSADRGKFMDNLKGSLSRGSSPVREKLAYAFHGALWDADKAMRTALFRDAIEGGATDAEAAAKANKYLIDYNNLTPFEQKVMQRVFPFYTWMKGNIPLQVEQWINNTPKQQLYEVAKDAFSQGLSGQPTHDGKIDTGEQLPDGSHVMIDPYAPADEPLKIGREGTLPFLYGRINPIAKELADLVTNRAYYPSGSLAPNGKASMATQPIFNPQAPLGYNIGAGASHIASNLLPINGVVGSLAGSLIGGTDSRGLIDQVTGMPDKQTPAQTPTELATKLLGGFSSRYNPEKDAYYEQRSQQDDLKQRIQYLKKTGQTVPKALNHEAYRRIPLPSVFQATP